MKLTTKLIALAITGGLAIGLAQPPAGERPDPPAPQALIDYLGLTDSQLASFEAIRQTAQTAAQPIAQDLRAKMMELRQAIRGGTADAAAIAALQTEITTLRDQLAQIRSDAAVQAKSALTADQVAKVETLEAAAALRQEVQQAARVGLLAPPEGEDGPGPGFGPGRRGPRGRGPRGF